MHRLAVLCALVTMAISQCPLPTTTGPPNNGSGTSGDGDGSRTCPKVKTINRPLSVIFTEEPVYYFLLSKEDRFINLDNACVTFFPLYDGCETFKATITYVYADGSYMHESYITRSNATGANIWSNADRTFVNYNLGYLGCGVFLRQSCPISGDSVKPFFLAFGPGLGLVGNGTGKITDECIQEGQRLTKENGLDLGDYYVLPYNLPTRCFTQQICQPVNSPLYCQQGNSCKAYTDYNETCTVPKK